MSSQMGNAPALSNVSNQDFLKAIFGNSWYLCHVTGFAGDPQDVSLPRSVWEGGSAGSWVLSPQENNYFAVSLFTGRRDQAYFDKLIVLAVDDVGPKVSAEKLRALPVRPTFRIETSPGNEQWGYVLAEPITVLAGATALIDAMAKYVGFNDARGVTRYIRLPVGSNGKPAALGWHCRLLELGSRITPEGQTALALVLSVALTGSDELEGSKVVPGPGGAFRGAGPEFDDLCEHDRWVHALRKLDLVQGRMRKSPIGRCFDIVCPWVDEHTDRAASGTIYVPLSSKFKCQHDHCAGRHAADLPERLDWLLQDWSCGLVRFRDVEWGELSEAEVPAEGRMRASSPLSPDSGLFDPSKKTPTSQWPGGVLPDWFEAAISALARRSRMSLGALAVSYLVAASGAADKRARLVPYAGDAWEVPPILWGLLVAESGQRKTAIFDLVTDRIKRVHGDRMKAYVRDHARWKTRPPANKDEPAPMPQVLLAGDTTLENLQVWLAHNPRGLFQTRDEIASLFEFGRYSTGKGAAERAFYLTSYEGGPQTIGRLQRGVTHIPNCALAMLGTTQPDRLAGFKDLADDGLLQRFGIVLMDETSAPAGGPPPDLTRVNEALDRLLTMGVFDTYHTDAEGEALIRATEARGDTLGGVNGLGGGFVGSMHKAHGTHARAALVLHMLNGASTSLIPADTVRRAGRYVGFLTEHAWKFYGGLEGSAVGVARSIASYLVRHGLTRVTAGLLRSNVAACRRLQTLEEIQASVQLLVVGGWLEPEEHGLWNKAWRVVPGVLERFSDWKKIEEARVERIKAAMNWLGRYSGTL